MTYSGHMDKKFTGKPRIAPAAQGMEDAEMNEDIQAELLDQAFDLAYAGFKTPSDDHIEAVYERLLFNHEHGLGADGALTLH